MIEACKEVIKVNWNFFITYGWKLLIGLLIVGFITILILNKILDE